MRSVIRLASVVALAAAVLGCGDQGGLLILTLSASPPITTDSVGLDVTAGGATHHHDVAVSGGSLTTLEVGVQLPPTALGSVSVTATAGGATVTGTTSVGAGQTERLLLSFGGANPDLGGDGGGDLGPRVALRIDGVTSFAATATGKVATHHFTINNDGDLDASNSGTAVFSVTLQQTGSVYALANSSCDGGVAAHSSCGLDVQFKPTVVMAGQTATLHAAFDDSASGATSIVDAQLTGDGITPSALVWVVPPSTAPYTFPITQIGQTSTVSFTLENTGAEVLHNVDFLLIGPHADQFSLSGSTCAGLALGKNDTCGVTVTYQPTLIDPGSSTELTVGADEMMATFDATLAGSAFDCGIDADGDGHPADSHCPGADCNDNDADNWVSCVSCVDNDGDGFFVGCDRFGVATNTVHLRDCNDSDGSFAQNPPVIGQPINCDGAALTVSDAMGVFVAPAAAAQNPGNDGNPGTQAAPVATLAKAVSLLGNNKRALFIGSTFAGNFTEALSVVPNHPMVVTIYGGYDSRSVPWTRGSPTSQINSATLPGATLTGPAFTAGKTPKLIVGIDFVDIRGVPDGLQATNTLLHLVSGVFLRGGNLITTDSHGAVLVSSTVELHGCGVEGGLGTNTAVGLLASSSTSLLIADNTTVAGITFPDIASTSSTAVAVDATSSVVINTGSSLFGNNDASGGGGSSFGLDCAGSATIRSSDKAQLTTLYGGHGGTATALRFTGSSLLVADASITGGNTPGDGIGVQIGPNLPAGAVAQIYDSLITTDDTGGTSEGIIIDTTTGSKVLLVNNLIDGGDSNQQTALRLQNGPAVTYAYNNIFRIAVSGNKQVGYLLDVAPSASSTGALSLLNNAFTHRTDLVTFCTLHNNTGCSTALPVNCAWDRCFANTANLDNQDCGLTPTTNHLPGGSACAEVGAATATQSAAGAVVTGRLDIDMASRPNGAWDIGPDEL